MKNTLKTWVLVVILGPILAYIIFAVAVSVMGVASTVAGNYFGKRHVLNANHAELLSAAREMISKYEQYTNEWDMTSSLVDGEKALSFWDLKNGYRYETDPRLPEAVRQMRPSSVVIGTNYMYIMPKYPERSRIVAYAEGVSTNTVPQFRGERTLLTNGLWLCR